MKTSLVFLIAFFWPVAIVFAQNRDQAEILVNEGVALHDASDYQSALNKYDEALKLDSANFLAFAEKAITLFTIKRYEESLIHSQFLIDHYKGDSRLANTYVTAANTLDVMQKTEEALDMYSAGISSFPNYYHLYFNKAITLSNLQRYDEAVENLERAVQANPSHPGSNHVLALLLNGSKKRIPSILSFCRFLILEPKSDRAKKDLAMLIDIMGSTNKKTGKNSTTITLTPEMLTGVKGDDKVQQNNFAITDMVLALAGALDYDRKYKDQTSVEKFIRKFERVCSSLDEDRPKGSGFYWDYYAPYFIELHNKKFIEAFAYFIFSTSDDTTVNPWLTAHEKEISDFLEWSKSYQW